MAIATKKVSRGAPATFGLNLITVGLALSPVYLFGSGGAQPGDLFIAAGSLASMAQAGFRMRRVSRHIPLALAAFLTWIVCVNLAWYSETGDPLYLRSSSWYLFNGLSFCAIIALANANLKRLAQRLYAVVAVNLVVQIAAIATMPSNHLLRETGTFNNPNQLGYYAVLSASLACLMRCVSPERSRLAQLIEYAVLGAAGYLAVISFSRAAIGAMLMLYIVHFKVKLRPLMVTGALMAIIFTMAVSGDQKQELRQYVEKRNQSFQAEVVHRGYARIAENPSMMLFGSGEGGNSGINQVQSREVHSTIGNIWFSYGFVGLALMAVLSFVCVRQGGINHARYLLPAVAYGMTHNGIRQTELWMLAGLVCAVGLYSRRSAVAKPGEKGNGIATHRECLDGQEI